MSPACTWYTYLGLAALRAVRVLGQDPGSDWKPNNWESLGIYCEKNSKNPNDPSGHLTGSCGCENTPLRIRGQLLMMESHSHGCDDIFQGYDTKTQGECSFFRLRDLTTGRILANVSQSLGHSFCSAVADYDRERLWVFCPAHARGNTVNPGPCDVRPYSGCYIGAWSASFDDLTLWSNLSIALTLSNGQALFNPDVTFVSGHWPATQGKVPGLPAHQAAMIMTGRSEKGVPKPGPFAVNTGVDGDLSKNWVLLDSAKFGASDASGKGTGTTSAATIVFDSDEGYYYTIGGGYITNGPARSANLTAGSWEVSPLAPMAIPDAIAAQAGLPPLDQQAGIYTKMYTEVWKDGVSPSLTAWLENSTAWNWGVTDVDVCCRDGQAPSYIMNTLSRQGAPAGVGRSYVYHRMGRSHMTLNDWFRSYFPGSGDSIDI